LQLFQLTTAHHWSSAHWHSLMWPWRPGIEM